MTAPTMRIGNVEIMSLRDAGGRMPCAALFPAVGANDWRPFEEHLAEDCTQMDLSISTFLVRSGGKNILIDSGIGAKDRRFFPNGRLPDALREEGVPPESIDLVLTTHMHIDHVGWHTTRVGEAYVPTFANATHVFVRDEYEYWTAPEVARAPGNEHIVDSVLPLDGHAEIELVDGEHRVNDELTLVPAPGHSPAHSAIAILSVGERGVFIGDLCHHPAQITECNWSPIFDMNPALAIESREKLLQMIEDQQAKVISNHIAAPGFGNIVRVDGKRYWRGV